DDPSLEGALVLGRPDSRPQVGHDAEKRLPDAEVLQGVGRLEGVVVVLAVVVDAAHAGPEHEVLVLEDLVPQSLDLLHLREEAVAADVEAPAVALDGAADATNL